ncbi:hypothetical protein GN244_ATG09200 [Phytophthora infestans]|uniref:Uncharacterized protein n=1 Tax=Phytophthora infestans TaxID=4787 RepID=A0A833SRI3_PHYIN|nr:hypothetical protein GN244_ATG09200 [Phytophthora infestans]
MKEIGVEEVAPTPPMKGQGCEELYANVSAIITFMTDKRREEQY